MKLSYKELENKFKEAEKKLALFNVSQSNNLNNSLLSDEVYKIMFDLYPDLISISEAETGCFIHINKAFEKFIGYNRNELIGKTSVELGIVTAAESKKMMDEFLKSPSQKVSNIFINKNKVQKEVLTSGYYFELSGKKCVMCIGVNQADFFTQKEKKQQNFEELFAVFNGLEGAAHVVDMRSYEILAANTYTEKLYGENLVGEICYKRYHKDCNTPCKTCRNNQLVDENGNIFPPSVYEFQNLINGRWYQCTDRAIRWPDGRLVKMEIALDIHEWKLTSDALKASEEKFKTLISKLPDVIVVHRDNKLLFISDQMFEITGLPATDYLGLPFMDFLHPEDQIKALEYSNKRRNGELVPEKYDARIKGSGSVYHTFEVRGSVIDYEGKPAILTVLTNITENKKIEEALLHKQEQYYNLVENAVDAIFHGDTVGNFIGVNPRACEMTGYSKEELLTMNMGQLFTPEQVSLKPLRYDLLKEGHTVRTERLLTRKDGSTLPIEMNTKMMPDKTYQSFFRDYTERKKMEEELLIAKLKAEESESKYKNMVSILPDGVVIHQEGKIIYYNQAASTIMKAYSSDKLLNKEVIDFVHPAYRELAAERIKKSIKDKIPANAVEEIFIDFEGNPVHVYVSAFPFQFEGKSSMLTVFSDITSLKEIEKELIKAKEKAEESDKLKSAFLANMSHEIRTPLNGILGFADILISEDVTDLKKKEFLEIINTNGKQLLGIINDIIDISKIEAGQLKINSVNCFLNQLMFNIYTVFHSELEEKLEAQVILNLHIPSERSILVHADDMKITQVLNNLIGNAIKFTHTGSIDIGYTLDCENYVIEFYVKDTGIGLSEEKQKIIFERFRQADDTTTRNYGGTGLGLAISRGLVELMGGKIWLQSEEGKGTVFYFTIPYNPIVVKESYIEPEKAFKKLAYDWTGKVILIVEDDHDSYLYLETLFEKNKASIFRVENGFEAVEFCRQNKNVSIVLMDIQTPLMNGYEATRLIREFNITLPIIAQTANAFAEDREKCLAVGCNDYIMKPIDVKLLYAMVDSFF